MLLLFAYWGLDEQEPPQEALARRPCDFSIPVSRRVFSFPFRCGRWKNRSCKLELLVGGLEHVLFSISYMGMEKIIPTDELTASFFKRGFQWFPINHQPDNLDTITNINQYSPTLSPAVNFFSCASNPFQSFPGLQRSTGTFRASQAYPAW